MEKQEKHQNDKIINEIKQCLAEMDQNQLNNLIRWNSNKLYINVYIKFYYKQYCKKIFNSKFLYGNNGTICSFDLIS